jgi:branched-subunit amino acid transport protein
MLGGADNFKNVSKSILYNQGVLYFIFALAVGNLLFMLLNNEFMSLAVFILVGFLTSFFSKNMVVILCVSMAVYSVLKFGTDLESLSDIYE